MFNFRTAKRLAVSMIAVLTVGAPVCAGEAVSTHAAGTVAEQVVQYAKSKTYITSRPNEVTRFWNLETDWCSMFVYYCAYQCGVPECVPYATFCDTPPSNINALGGVEIFKNRGQWELSPANGGDYVPKTGDVIYFDLNNNKKADHVGFVDYVSGGFVHTVEGNAGFFGDCVKLNTYPLTYSEILGYGTPDYDKSSGGTAPTVTKPQQPAVTTAAATKPAATTTTQPAGELPAKYRVASPIGAWLRDSSSSKGKKLGILSTDQIVTADRISGSWVHIQDTSLEDLAGTYSGWTAITNLEEFSGSPVTTAATTTTAPATTTTTAAAPVKPAQNTSVYRVDSAVGAWFRSSPEFSRTNTLGILDTDEIVTVSRIDGEWAYGQAEINGRLTSGYVHLSTLAKDITATTVVPEDTVTYKVTSDIGCWLRSDPEFSDSNLLALLDTDERIEVVNIYNGWACVKISADSHAVYGYVHTSNISKA